MVIRQAMLADLAALAALEEASFVCDGVSRRAMAGFLRSRAALVLAADAAGAAGDGAGGAAVDDGAGGADGADGANGAAGDGAAVDDGAGGAEGGGAAGGDLRGHLVLRFNARHRIARIYSIAVAASAMGQGVGTALVAAAESAARARGSRSVRLEISVDNRASQALFRRCGYQVFGHYDAYYEDGGAALRLQKAL